MKYLKKFNESFDEELWEIVTAEEFLNYCGGIHFKRLVSFNDKDIELIKKSIGDFSFEITEHPINNISNYIKMYGHGDMINLDTISKPNTPWWQDIIRGGNGSSLTILIFKNDDDFYLIGINLNGYKNYILCDTIDGVVSFFTKFIKPPL